MTGGNNKILNCLKCFSREDLEELQYWNFIIFLPITVFEGKSITLELLLVAARTSCSVPCPVTPYLLEESDDTHQWIQPCPWLGYTLLWGREELWLSLADGCSWTSGTQSFSHMFLWKGTSLLFSCDQDSSYWGSTSFRCSMNTPLHPAYSLVQYHPVSPNSHT